VGCKAKDVDAFWRERDINDRLWMLMQELPRPFGFAASVRSLADELAEAKDSGDRDRALATARLCGKAAKLAHG
jgi:hypothetical protein